jgi:sirohydrochlorin cobaltochelatase
VLVKRIYGVTDAMAARHPAIEFLKAPYLNDHDLVLDAFADRVQEILVGDGKMNCLMCKYREQVVGFEAEVGLPQAGHHHHVEGIGTAGDQAHDHHRHDHEHDHDHHHHDHHHHDGHGHHHHHAPHPHADHPHGPGRRNPERVE